MMPTHLHAIVFDHEHNTQRLDSTLSEFRKFTGHALADYCAIHAPTAFNDTLHNAAGKDRLRRFWQPTRHPVGIQTQGFWPTKFDYLHDNPCRKALVWYPEDWRFSSARYYRSLEEGRNGEIVVPITQLDWWE